MNKLLTLAAVIEAATGLALMGMPPAGDPAQTRNAQQFRIPDERAFTEPRGFL